MDAAANPETRLLRLLEAGHVRRAAHLLVTEHADEVYGLCRAMLRDATAAEDLSQDVFTKAFRALPRFRGDASVRTWILRITRNACIDHLRARQREPWAHEDEPDAHPVEEPDVSDLLSRRESVSRALDALEENERALVVLRFGHGLGYPELADAFALKPGAVRMRVSRALSKMRATAASPAAPKAKRARRRLSSEPVSAPAAAPMSAPVSAPVSAPMSAPPPTRAPAPELGPPGAPPVPGAPPAPAQSSGGRGGEGSEGPFDAMPRRPVLDSMGLEDDGSMEPRHDLDDELGEVSLDSVGPEAQRYARGAPPAKGAILRARSGGWFGWLFRLFERDRATGEPPPAPEAPPTTSFSRPTPPGLRTRLGQMASGLDS